MSAPVIGLIGGIAAGKSEVAECFRELGVTVIDTDQIARELVAEGMPAFKAIEAHFGKAVMTATGELDRTCLKARIFSNLEDRLWLEGLLHPAIRHQVEKKVKAADGLYCLVSIPLLKRREDYPYLQRILLVEAPLPQQIERLMKRDRVDEILASQIMAAQPSPTLRWSLADDHIINDGDLTHLKEQVVNQHKIYLSSI